MEMVVVAVTETHAEAGETEWVSGCLSKVSMSKAMSVSVSMASRVSK